MRLYQEGNPRNFYDGRSIEIRVKFALRQKISTRDNLLWKKVCQNHHYGAGVKRCRAQHTTRSHVDPRVLWPRSRDFERRFRLTPAMVEYLAGEFYNSSINLKIRLNIQILYTKAKGCLLRCSLSRAMLYVLSASSLCPCLPI